MPLQLRHLTCRGSESDEKWYEDKGQERKDPNKNRRKRTLLRLETMDNKQSVDEERKKLHIVKTTGASQLLIPHTSLYSAA